MDRIYRIGCRFHGDLNLVEVGTTSYTLRVDSIDLTLPLPNRGFSQECVEYQGAVNPDVESAVPQRIVCQAPAVVGKCGVTVATTDDDGVWFATEFAVNLPPEVD